MSAERSELTIPQLQKSLKGLEDARKKVIPDTREALVNGQYIGNPKYPTSKFLMNEEQSDDQFRVGFINSTSTVVKIDSIMEWKGARLDVKIEERKAEIRKTDLGMIEDAERRGLIAPRIAIMAKRRWIPGYRIVEDVYEEIVTEAGERIPVPPELTEGQRAVAKKEEISIGMQEAEVRAAKQAVQEEVRRKVQPLIEVSGDYRILVVRGETMKLRPAVAAVFKLLARNLDRRVSTLEVNESARKAGYEGKRPARDTINALRSRLEADVTDPHVIVTIGKKGYSLRAQVKFLQGKASAAVSRFQVLTEEEEEVAEEKVEEKAKKQKNEFQQVPESIVVFGQILSNLTPLRRRIIEGLMSGSEANPTSSDDLTEEIYGDKIRSGEITKEKAKADLLAMLNRYVKKGDLPRINCILVNKTKRGDNRQSSLYYIKPLQETSASQETRTTFDDDDFSPSAVTQAIVPTTIGAVIEVPYRVNPQDIPSEEQRRVLEYITEELTTYDRFWHKRMEEQLGITDVNQFERGLSLAFLTYSGGAELSLVRANWTKEDNKLWAKLQELKERLQVKTDKQLLDRIRKKIRTAEKEWQAIQKEEYHDPGT